MAKHEGRQARSTISVNLPDHLKSYVDENANPGGFASASDYIVSRVAAASEKQNETGQALIAGINSGPSEELTSQEWRSIRNRAAAKGL